MLSLLDTKPYIAALDYRPDVKTGWLEYIKADFESNMSDDHFRFDRFLSSESISPMESV